MESGNFAEAQLRALIDVAAAAAGAHRLEEVLELAGERALEAVGAASLSISRWYEEEGILRTLVNVGDVSPLEERFPADETYSVRDFPTLTRLMGGEQFSAAAVDDPNTDKALRDLLGKLGKEACLSVSMVLEGKAWGELEVFTAHGQPRLSETDAGFLRAIADQLVGAIHRAELFAKVEALAYTDSLTGVGSRRAVELALEDACAEPAGPGSPALVLCDIDDLKRVNDYGGHEAGDRALCRAAEALVLAARKFPDAVVGRFGGDEFCVLLPTGTVEDARAVATAAVQSLRTAGGERISCGVAGRTDGESPVDLLRAADEAQYRAKRAGDYVDVVAAGDPTTEPPEPQGRDRAFRAGDPEAVLARDLLDMLDGTNGNSAEERLARLRARLEQAS
jgi:diguanylate cyclase (GGDEF)-like protein